jgi:proline iminopeptidase
MDFKRLFVVIGTLLLFAGCMNEDTGSPARSTGRLENENPETTAENYLSGRAFCKEYSKLTKYEFGKFIPVPKDYANPSSGTTEIYAWTMRPFDPKKPSFIYLDGGPGGNSHGQMSEYVGSSWNEIHFDQRGIGCSSPATYDQYVDPNLYSTTNTIADMEMIRKSFGIQKWSVFGTSYGTILATRYASRFPRFSNAAVLEGTVFDTIDIHDPAWRADKLNIALSKLTESQRQGFEDIYSNEEYAFVADAVISSIVYYDNGFKIFKKFVETATLPDGHANKEILDQMLAQQAGQSGFKYPQNPSGSDPQVRDIIFCKELGQRTRDTNLGYDFNSHRFTVTKGENGEQHCLAKGVPASEEHLYLATDYPIFVPVTYFQGSHDGATLARGAIKHWQNVPKSTVSFAFAAKGGHSPLSQAILGSPSDSPVRLSAIKLLKDAVSGLELQNSDINKLNISSENRWFLYHKPPQNWRDINNSMEDIRPRIIRGFAIAN